MTAVNIETHDALKRIGATDEDAIIVAAEIAKAAPLMIATRADQKITTWISATTLVIVILLTGYTLSMARDLGSITNGQSNIETRLDAIDKKLDAVLKAINP